VFKDHSEFGLVIFYITVRSEAFLVLKSPTSFPHGSSEVLPAIAPAYPVRSKHTIFQKKKKSDNISPSASFLTHLK